MDIERRVLRRLVGIQAEQGREVQAEECYHRVYEALHVVAPVHA